MTNPNVPVRPTPFVGDTAKCPKCLHTVVLFQHMPARHPSGLTGEIPGGPEATSEHLLRTCARCKYSYAEVPADAR